jgi:hypothetical protein
VNSVLRADGTLFVSQFGPHEPGQKASADRGSVIDIGSGATVLEGLHHPHSLCAHDGRVLVADSARRRVLDVFSGEVVVTPEQLPDGYTRGLAAEAGTLWVGTSGPRLVSKSEGTLNESVEHRPEGARLTEVDVASGVARRTLDLTVLGRELYDVRLLPPRFAAPACDHDPVRARVVELELAVHERDKRLAELTEVHEATLGRRFRRRVGRMRRRWRRGA